jgi:polyphosphate kinase
MTRNTEKRVEIAFPVDDLDLKDEIRSMMEIMLSDNVKARRINEKGDYERIIREGEKVDAQKCLMQRDYSPPRLD